MEPVAASPELDPLIHRATYVTKLTFKPRILHFYIAETFSSHFSSFRIRSKYFFNQLWLILIAKIGFGKTGNFYFFKLFRALLQKWQVFLKSNLFLEILFLYLLHIVLVHGCKLISRVANFLLSMGKFTHWLLRTVLTMLTESCFIQTEGYMRNVWLLKSVVRLIHY